MEIQTKCSKCGAVIRLNFGALSKAEALEAAERLDSQPGECPGHHVELGGLARLWQVREAIRRAYDQGQGEPPQPISTDHDYVQSLLADGQNVIDGGLNTVPELELHSLHEFRGLKHLGFGHFASDTELFERADSPRGTRFYIRTPR